MTSYRLHDTRSCFHGPRPIPVGVVAVQPWRSKGCMSTCSEGYHQRRQTSYEKQLSSSNDYTDQRHNKPRKPPSSPCHQSSSNQTVEQTHPWRLSTLECSARAVRPAGRQLEPQLELIFIFQLKRPLRKNAWSEVCLFDNEWSNSGDI